MKGGGSGRRNSRWGQKAEGAVTGGPLLSEDHFIPYLAELKWGLLNMQILGSHCGLKRIGIWGGALEVLLAKLPE